MKDNGMDNKNPPVFVDHCLKFKAHKKDQPAKNHGDHISSLNQGEECTKEVRKSR